MSALLQHIEQHFSNRNIVPVVSLTDRPPFIRKRVAHWTEAENEKEKLTESERHVCEIIQFFIVKNIARQ
jgi:hypothetical protein